MMSYDSDPKEYARLAGFGYRMLAGAIKADLPYHIISVVRHFLSVAKRIKRAQQKDIIGNGIRDFISGIIAVISVLVILAGTYMTSSGIKNCK